MTFATGNRLGRTAAGRGGFTLIELMVVILIIATLMSIMLVVYTQLQKRAKENLYQTQRRSLQSACQTYKLEYGDWPKEAQNTYKTDNFRVMNLLKDASPVPVLKPDDFNFNAQGSVLAKDGIPFKFTFTAESVTVD